VSDSELLQRLRAVLGVRLGEPVVARDPVNLPMIRHWCDALDDRNPVYTDPAFAERSLHGGIVAPPTMLQAWSMRGLVPKEEREAQNAAGVFGVLRLLDEGGFTSVVATNCTQEYRRYLRPGDLLSGETVIEAVSEEKKTALGRGHFVTQHTTYRDQHGEIVASMRFRLLKFRPAARASAAAPRRGRDRGPSPPSPTTTASSGKDSRKASCASSVATPASASSTRPAPCARAATGSISASCVRRDAAASTASSSLTTRQSRRSRFRI
jgi:acyl dehydratase